MRFEVSLEGHLHLQTAWWHPLPPFAGEASGKVFDAFFSDIPLVGLFCNYVFNPSYLLTTSEGDAFRIKKSPSLFGNVFHIEKLNDSHQDKDILCLMGILMMEKSRGVIHPGFAKVKIQIISNVRTAV